MNQRLIILLIGAVIAAPFVAYYVMSRPQPASAAVGDDPETIRALMHLPDGVPLPSIPDANPLTAEKIALGRALFYDTNLSANQTQSCASCHDQALAFTDGLPRPLGSTRQRHNRNAQPLFNLAFLPNYTWASNALTTLEDQIHIPIRSDRPVELGVNDGNAAEILARFTNDQAYRTLFAAAFPDSDGVPSWNRIVHALASFLRTMTSFGSRYDQYLAGDNTVLTDLERQGLALFNSERLECFHCHAGPNLTTAYVDAGDDPDRPQFIFFSNGLYNVGNAATYPAYDRGLYDLTLNRRHMGLFRPPSLRNIALTGPYMHDGSLATLDAVIDHYAAGGTVTADGPLAGDGRILPTKSSFVQGFSLTDIERAALIAFLESLTDEGFLQRADLGPIGTQP